MTYHYLVFYDDDQDPEASVEFMSHREGCAMGENPNITWREAQDLLVAFITDQHTYSDKPTPTREFVMELAGQFVGAFVVTKSMLESAEAQGFCDDAKDAWTDGTVHDDSWRDEQIGQRFDALRRCCLRAVGDHTADPKVKIPQRVALGVLDALETACARYETAGLEDTVAYYEIALALEALRGPWT